jgi:hypothetical protein
MDTTEAATAETPAPEQDEQTPDFAQLADLGSPDEIRKALGHARTWEQRAKENKGAASELEKLRRDSMSDQERAVDEARAEARAEALSEIAADRAADAIRLAAKGRIEDVDTLLEGVNAAKFVGEDGSPDRDAITKWIDGFAPSSTANTAPQFPDLAQGARNSAVEVPGLNSPQLLSDLKAAVGAR